MIRHLAIVLAACALVAADSKEEQKKKELVRFEGTWTVKAAEFDGKQRSANDLLGAVIYIQDNAMSCKGIQIGKGQRATFTIDPFQNPRAIDLVPSDGIVTKGIYQFGENTLKICFNPRSTGRPTNFDSKAGSGLATMVLKREKPRK